MPYWKGEKWACYSCTKGHRSSKCTHYDRILYKVRKPGRPLNNCPHILPDSIPPGTFVNTSAESMANGQPPKEACNCRNDLVQVAIPKVKSCSCLTPGTVGSISAPPPPLPPPPLPPHEPVTVTQSGVKKGRIIKRPTTARRKKSIVSEEAVESFRADAVRLETAAAQSEPPGDHNCNEMSGVCRASCTTPGWDTYDFLVGPTGNQPDAHFLRRLALRDNPPADANNHSFGQTVPELNGLLLPTAGSSGGGGSGGCRGGCGGSGGSGGGGGDGNSNVRVPESPLVSPTIGGEISHPSPAQNGEDLAFLFHSSYDDDGVQKDQNSDNTHNACADQLNNHKPQDQNYYPAPALGTIPQQQSAVLFPQARHPGIGVDGKPNGHRKNLTSPVQTTPVNGGLGIERPVTAVLSSVEWSLIEQIRLLGVDVGELLARVVMARRQQQETTELAFSLALGTHNGQPEVNGSPSSSANSPFTNLDSAHGSPPATDGAGGGGGGGGGGGCCSSGNVRTSCHPPSSPPVNYPTQGGSRGGGGGGGGGTGGRGDEAPLPKEPGSPRCKCGEACRCVPCADHPHNPAMMAFIKENVELMESPLQQHHMYDASSHLAGAKWYGDDGTGDGGGAGEMEDLNNFVFAAYPYGSECSNEGSRGECKCSEGCTCVGCLTHGGHNGLPLGV